ncbi:LapA family protein [Vagococcus humatus]|uniref:DUF1049 domain-containing protein n=1 Tax=Vagococcus humatus TaxID=1889241 RepID=A0A3R9YDX1_9ENTE|nr:LapA family protein [Vagococcus humatus]RST90082.1 DUF1049 domain-containing protein [Vagococcus humatus]
MKHHGKLLLGFVLVFVIAIFSVINTEPVIVNFGFKRVQSPLIFTILGSALIGALIVLIAWSTSFWKQRKELKELRYKIGEQEAGKEAAVAKEREYYDLLLHEKNQQIGLLETKLKDLEGSSFIEEPRDLLETIEE